MKESETIEKYLDLAGELKKTVDIRMTVIPVVIGALWIDSKGCEKRLEIKDRIKTIQTTVMLRLARILRRVQETCCHLNSSER